MYPLYIILFMNSWIHTNAHTYIHRLNHFVSWLFLLCYSYTLAHFYVFLFFHNTYIFCLHTGHVSLCHFIMHPVWKRCLHTKYVGFESSLTVNDIRQIKQTSCTYVFIVSSRNSGIEGTALLCGCACLCCLASNGGTLLKRPLSISRW